MLTNVSTVHIIVMHKRLVLTQTEAIVVLVKQDLLAMVQRVQVCGVFFFMVKRLLECETVT